MQKDDDKTKEENGKSPSAKLSEAKLDLYKHVLAFNVKRLRKGKGLSQAGLAKLSHISKNTVCNIEAQRGFFKLSTLSDIAIALDVDMLDLYKADDMQEGSHAYKTYTYVKFRCDTLEEQIRNSVSSSE